MKIQTLTGILIGSLGMATCGACMGTSNVPLPEPPVTVVEQDAGIDSGTDATKDASPFAPVDCFTACANLSRLGCPEGKNASCVEVCVRVQTTHLVRIDPVCLTNATSVDEVRKCGPVKCK